jgi:hypothetical protein
VSEDKTSAASAIAELVLALNGASDNGVWGMGLGATPQARRWAAIGMAFDRQPILRKILAAGLKSEFIATPKRGRGRPKAESLADADCYRAYSCWNAVRLWGRPDYTNKRAIALVIEIERILMLNGERIELPFSRMVQSNLEESVSRGKGKLEIGRDWKSARCERINSSR